MVEKPAQPPAPSAPNQLAKPVRAEVARVSTRFRDYVLDRAQEDAPVDGQLHEVTATMLDKMLTASTLDDIMNADMMTTYESRDLIGLRIEIPPQTLRYANSFEQFNAALGVYVQFQATALEDFDGTDIISGDQIVVSSGAPLVIGKLRSLEANELLPVRVQICGYNSAGGTVLKLKGIKPSAGKTPPSA